MPNDVFPNLDRAGFSATRDALHAYARVIGAWAVASRRRRKHWWHASLRPALCGMTTGLVTGPVDYELEFDIAHSQVHVHTVAGTTTAMLTGQSAAQVGEAIEQALVGYGVDPALAPGEKVLSADPHADYSAAAAGDFHSALLSVTAAMEDFRAGVREETSPIQVWPHHFDLSMIWLPGPKIAGQDPADEEHADKQMNFGFVFGDASVPEPYFYVTAYPLPDALPELALPAGTRWQTEGFQGAVLKYRDLLATDDPHAYLLDLWQRLIDEGRKHLTI